METRRLIMAIFASLAVYFAYMSVRNMFREPPPKPDPNAPAAVTPAPSDANQPIARQDPTTPAVADPNATTQPQIGPAPVAADALSFTAGTALDPITLGGGVDDALRVAFDPRGGAISGIWLTKRRAPEPDAPYVHRLDADSDEPYQLLRSLDDGSRIHGSYLTRRLVLHRTDDHSLPLDKLIWQVAPTPNEPNTIAFTTELMSGDPATPLLRLTKRFTLVNGGPLIELDLTVDNLSGQPLRVSLDQDGPIGLLREQDQWDMRRLLAALYTDGAVEIAEKADRSKLKKAADKGEMITLATTTRDGPRLAWIALTNRFFGVFTRPLPITDAPPTFVRRVQGTVAAPAIPESQKPGDLLARMTLAPLELGAGESTTRGFEIYAGAKDADKMAEVNPAFADNSQIGYGLAQYADRMCLCTFEPLPWIMLNLLHTIHWLLPNYGVAIIIMVIIIRSMLHPLTVFQQKSMFKMQENMARLQPKMQGIKEKYANDKTKQNQEMMRLFSEEGVNPAGGMVSMIPMFIQMPILVALWVSLNADVELRHAPFMLWIDDLSSPDQLMQFGGSGLTIPLLGQLLPFMFANIPAFNLLPVLMGVSMYVQQKYMPKPAQQARREAAQKKANESGQDSQFEQQMKQQQTMAVMMSFMFPLMFYYMPAGLNLYWMATNVFGIGETLLIRRQLNAERERREREGPRVKPSKKPGMLSRVMKHMAEQAEELQRKADEVTDQPGSRKRGGKDNPASKDKPNGKKGRR